MRGTTEKQAPTLPVQWVYDEVIHNQKGDSDMTKEEAIEILKNGGWWDLLIPITTIEGRSDEGKLHQAIDMAITALHSMPEAEALVEHKELTTQLRRMSVETGSLVCLGCGYEHNCGIHGCALLRQAAETIERQAAALEDLRDHECSGLVEE